MAITVYRSNDVGAPVLTGTAGDFLNLIKTCLVTGYGSKEAAGWAESYTGTNKAVYRAPAGNRFYLRIDDTSGQYPILRGYETMSAIDTGSGDFPLIAALSSGIRGIKSSTSDAVARPWILIAGTRAFYLWTGYGLTSFTTMSASVDILFFGDLVSYCPGDAFHTALIGRPTADTSVSTTRVGEGLLNSGGTNTGHYLARSYLQVGASIPCGCLQSNPPTNASMGSGGTYYPDPVTGGLLLDLVRVCEGETTTKLVRGHLPGLFNPLHNQPANHLDTIQGRGAMVGTDLLLLYKGGTAGRIALSLNEAHWLSAA
jgi:hypothetical protein